jgi:hypothetical protein
MLRFPLLRYFEIALQFGFFWFILGKNIGLDEKLPFLFPVSSIQTIVLVHMIMMLMLNTYHVFSALNPFTKNCRRILLGLQPLLALLFCIQPIQSFILIPMLIANAVSLLSMWPEQRYRKSLEAHRHILNRKF